MMAERTLLVGDPGPLFVARASNNERFLFHTAAGRRVVLTFFESSASLDSRELLACLLGARDLFDDRRACWFGVTVDAGDERERRVSQQLPGMRFFWDSDRAISRLYGCDGRPYRRRTIVLDERLRVLATRDLDGPAEEHVRWLRAVLEAANQVPDQMAPVLVVPRVFEPELCRSLIDHYDAHGGRPSGFMREVGGRTVALHDATYKRRRDAPISDPALRDACRERLVRRLFPQVHAAFQFQPTRIERYIVAAYDAEEGGWFRPHRDNTSAGTAHRRFAVTLNLNTGAYEGGGLSFPEFGDRTYVAPAGGAVVFSCSLLHEAQPVLRGRRYVFLPFLYDEAAAEVRERNRHLVDLGDEDLEVGPASVASAAAGPGAAARPGSGGVPGAGSTGGAPSGDGTAPVRRRAPARPAPRPGRRSRRRR